MISMQTSFLSYIWLAILVCLATCNYDLSNGALSPFDTNYFFKIKRKNLKQAFLPVLNPFNRVLENNLTNQYNYKDLLFLLKNYDNTDNNNEFNDNLEKLQSQLSQSSNSHTTSSSFLYNNVNNQINSPSSSASNEITNLVAKITHNNQLNHNRINYNYNPNNALSNEKNELRCRTRKYQYRAENRDNYGRYCYEDVTISTCYGRCDTGEFPDYRFPYKKSFHHVCIHDKMNMRKIRLKHCTPDDIDMNDNLRIYEYVEAQTCKCSNCQSSLTSCEGLAHALTTSTTSSFRR